MPLKRQKRRMSARTARRVRAQFLEAYSRLGNCTAVQAETGISRHHHKHWLKTSEEYRKQFEEADDQATELLEIEARRRAVEGRVDPVFYNGVQVGTVTKYSDLLLIFLLKSKRPDVYREYFNKTTQNLNVQSAVKVVHEYHDQPATVDITALESHPNKQLMSASTTPVPIAELTESKVGKPAPKQPFSQGLAKGTSCPVHPEDNHVEEPLTQPYANHDLATEDDLS